MKPTSSPDPARRTSQKTPNTPRPPSRSHTPHSERGRHEDTLRHSPHGTAPRTSSRDSSSRDFARRDKKSESGADVVRGDNLNRGDRTLPHSDSSSRAASKRKAPVREEKSSEEIGGHRLQAARHRRARQKVRATAWAFLIPTAIFSLILMAMTSVVMGDRRRFSQEVEAAQAQLSALEAQLAVGERRVKTLHSPKGREQLLVEHGYIKPGERILLFPADKETNTTPEAKNDLTPRRSAITGQDGGSPWRRAGSAISRWLENWSGSQTR